MPKGARQQQLVAVCPAGTGAVLKKLKTVRDGSERTLDGVNVNYFETSQQVVTHYDTYHAERARKKPPVTAQRISAATRGAPPSPAA